MINVDRTRYNRKNTGITISIFYEQHQLKKYKFNAPYQRDFNVWDDVQKSFLIDTIMKNFPMPPIFLEQKINAGKTFYDVIDGKQRLSTIIDFIENKIKLPNTFGKDIYGNEEMNGKKFDDLKELSKKNNTIDEYISDFWAYVINVEYIENPDPKIVDNIFDRLNRGGERLNSQELRKANYYDSILYQTIESIRFDPYLLEMLSKLDKNRLADISFITEIFLLIITNKIIDGTEKQIDKFFENLVDKIDQNKVDNISKTFNHIIQILKDINLNYDKYKINGVSHLYAICYLAYYMHINKIEVDKNIIKKINDFYIILRSDNKNNDTIDYNKSMQSGSKYKSSRTKRIKALLNFMNLTTSK